MGPKTPSFEESKKEDASASMNAPATTAPAASIAVAEAAQPVDVPDPDEDDLDDLDGKPSQVALAKSSNKGKRKEKGENTDKLFPPVDLLEDFATVKMTGSAQQPRLTQSTNAAPSQATPRPIDASTKLPATTSDEPEFSEEDFAKQLQAGMADLIGELEKSV